MQAGRAVRNAAAEIAANDPDWTWEEMQNRRPLVRERKNGANRVLAAVKMLPPDWMHWRNPAVYEKLGLNENDRDVLDEVLDPVRPCCRLDDQYLRLVRAEVERAGPALAEALQVTDTPQGRFPIEWRPAYFDTNLEKVQQSRSVAALLGHAALVRAHDGDFREALGCVRAGLCVARALGDEPCVLTYVVRVAHVHTALQSLESTLALGRPSVSDFAELAVVMASEDEEAPALCLNALRGERAGAHKMFQAYEHGEVSLAELMRLVDMNPNGAGIMGPLVVTTVRETHAAYLRHLTALIEAAKRPEADQPELFKEALRALDADPKAVFARRLVPAVDRVVTTQLRCQARLRCAQTGLAAERYRQNQGQWPDSLDALVPEYLSRIPVDPFDGQPVRLRRTPDGVAIYSVGPDRKDDGGVLGQRNVAADGEDVGIRLWDEAKRGRKLPPE
jgi:hypothetical protein